MKVKIKVVKYSQRTEGKLRRRRWAGGKVSLPSNALVPKNDKMHLADMGFHLDLTDFV